jgi:hypothetical protein
MRMEEREILAIVELEETEAYGYVSGTLSHERAENLRYFNSEPFGNEEDGRSQVVLSEVADVIEGIMPSLCKLFAGGDDVVKFEPRNGEDIPLSEQETEYCNYIATQKNPWFRIFYVWAKDALIQKVGYVKVYWEEVSEVMEERYRALSDMEMTMILQDKNLEIIEHEQSEVLEQTPQGMVPVLLHNIKVKYTEKYGKICIENIPPEELLVSTKCRSPNPKDADFVEHRTQRTISSLREAGYKVEDEVRDDWNANDYESYERDLFDENDYHDDRNDPAMRRVWVRDVYIKLDIDGDGIAELSRLVIVGKTILEQSKCEFIPFSAITPYITPHRHVGRAVADLVKDLQLIKSTVMRTELDGAFLSLHGRHAINQDRVDLDDMLTSRAGGVVRVKGDPAGAILPLSNPHPIGQGFSLLEYLDTIKENRTGVTKYNQGLDSQSLNKTATGISKIMNAAQERILLIARVFAETGVKELFLNIHALTRLYQNKPEVIRLRNKWVEVDPRDWKKRADMVVSVGLGTGDKDAQLQHLNLIGQYMQQAAQMGIVTPKNVYNLGAKIIQNAGYKMPEDFITDPEGENVPPKSPTPEQIQEGVEKMAMLEKELQAAQAKLMQADQAKAQSAVKETAMGEKQKLDQYSAKLSEEQRQLDYEKEIFRLQKELDAFKEQQEGEMAGHMEQTKAAMEADKPDVLGSVADMLAQLREEMGSSIQQAMQESSKKPTHIQKVRDGKGKMIKVILHYEDGTNRETNFIE